MAKRIVCQQCGKEYPAQGAVCPFCGAAQSPAAAKPKRAGSGRNLLIAVVGFIALGVVGNLLGQLGENGRVTPTAMTRATRAAATQVSQTRPTSAGSAPAAAPPVVAQPSATLVPSRPSTPASASAPARTATPSAITAVVNTDSINLRSGPGTTFAAFASLHNGDKATITGKNNDGSWYQVEVPGGATGWVSASLVTLSGADTNISVVADAAGPAPTTAPPAAPAVQYKGLLGRIWTNVKVYYGNGAEKTYGFTILGGAEGCSFIPSGRGVFVQYPSGSREWKDRDALLYPPFYSRADDPAVSKMEWYVYPCVR